MQEENVFETIFYSKALFRYECGSSKIKEKDAYLYTSVHIQSLTWMISAHVKEIVRKIIRSNHLSHTSIKRNLRFSHCCMQKREKIHKID